MEHLGQGDTEWRSGAEHDGQVRLEADEVDWRRRGDAGDVRSACGRIGRFVTWRIGSSEEVDAALATAVGHEESFRLRRDLAARKASCFGCPTILMDR